MTINVSGSYSSWNEKRVYSVSLWDCDETMVKVIIDTLENRMRNAVKESDYETISDLAISLKNLTDSFAEAINDAREEEDTYKAEQQAL